MKNFIKIGVLICLSLSVIGCQSDSEKLKRLEASAEQKADMIASAIRAGNLDSVRVVSMADDMSFYIFDGMNLVFWSDNAIALSNLYFDSLGEWKICQFDNARCLCRWTSEGCFYILSVIPVEWQINEKAEIETSFSYQPLLTERGEKGNYLVWWQRLRVRLRVYFIFLFITFAIIAAWIVYNLSRHHGFRNLKIRQKYQLLIAVIIIFGFGYIFVMSVSYVRKHFEMRQQIALRQKCKYVQSALQNLYYWDFSLDRMNTAGLNVDLRDLAYTYGTDIHVYDMNGHLVGSSTPQLFTQGLLSPNLAPEVFFGKDDDAVLSERIGNTRYLAGYTKFYNGSFVQIGYISVPFFISQEDMLMEVDNYLARLIPPYMIILFLSLFVSMILSRVVAAPLGTVTERMRHFSLDKADNHIYYPYTDEIGELVKRYNEMVDELDRSMRKLARSEREGAWRTMARQIAHEINNPLTPMKLTIQQLQRVKGTERFDVQFDKASAMLVEQIDNLSRIAVSFSTFAKMPEVQVSEVDVAEKLSQVVALQQNNPSGVPVRYVGPDNGIVAEADKEQISQVFINIIKNAIQAIEENGDGDIIVILRDADDNADLGVTGKQWIEITISDNGPGIPEEVRPKIFMPNFTTKSTGTGLGLAISKNIVEGSDGKLTFRTSDKGTTFSIYLRKA